MTHSLRLRVIAVLLVATSAYAQEDFDAVQIETIPVSDNIYMLTGLGGNIALSVGDDGAFLVDDQYAPLSDRILAAVEAVTDAPVRFVINTHWHWDHVGGNENMAETGAILVAHENVRRRMSTAQFVEALGRHTEPSPEGALPLVTFTDHVTFHWNGDEIRVFHVAPGHTDGDALIHFVGADVIHAGDNYFSNRYPLVDFSSGGTLEGMLANVDAILEIAEDETKIIPGHGPLSDRTQLLEYRAMLTTARDRITALIQQGLDREAVIAAKPTSDLDEKWGWGFLNPDMWVGIIYDALTRAPR